MKKHCWFQNYFVAKAMPLMLYSFHSCVINQSEYACTLKILFILMPFAALICKS